MSCQSVVNELDDSSCEVPQSSSRKRKGGWGGVKSKGEASGNYLLPNKLLCRRKCESNLACQRTQLKLLPKSPLSKGEEAKKLFNVVQLRLRTRKRQPNIVCCVEAFGKVCEKLDDRRRRWVREMGFGGLLHLVGLTLPRTLCYWLMTRANPKKETILLNDGLEYTLTPNQVRWVLGLPLGGKDIPRKSVDEEINMKEKSMLFKFGIQRHGVIKGKGKEIHSKRVTLSESTLDQLKEDCNDEEEDFKTSFLLMSLYFVLCPTQSVCLESDLLPALTLAPYAHEYDWSSLVVEKLMGSVSRFLKKFNVDGYAGGCGGCSLFVVLCYPILIGLIENQFIGVFIWHPNPKSIPHESWNPHLTFNKQVTKPIIFLKIVFFNDYTPSFLKLNWAKAIINNSFKGLLNFFVPSNNTKNTNISQHHHSTTSITSTKT